MKRCILTALICGAIVSTAHEHENQSPLQVDPFELDSATAPTTEYWLDKYGLQIDQPFSGPLSFSHLPYARCLEERARAFDIAVLGLPFDTAVSYRPGARFGPHAIRAGSRRQRPIRGYTLAWGNNPYAQGSDIVDCGDVPVSPFDNALAIDQIEVAYSTLLARPVKRNEPTEAEGSTIHQRLRSLARDGVGHPRVVRSVLGFSL